jgi:sugar lactone lactonase YvrE
MTSPESDTATGRRASTLIDGLALPECPRWRDGRLWFVDLVARSVLAIDHDGRAEEVAHFDDVPSGLGFLPDGDLIVALKDSQTLVRINPADGRQELYADLRHLGGHHLNDLIVDEHGVVYVAWRAIARDPAVGIVTSAGADAIVAVDPDTSIYTAAGGLVTPNGLALSSGDGVFVVAESLAGRLVAYSFESGRLSSPRVVRSFEFPSLPDGICLDASGGVWVAALGAGFLLVSPSGEIADRIPVARGEFAMACALGGPDRRSLFMAVAVTSFEELKLHRSRGSIATLEVDVPGAGIP